MATIATPGEAFSVTVDTTGQVAPTPVVKTSLESQQFEGTVQSIPKQVAENFKWGR